MASTPDIDELEVAIKELVGPLDWSLLFGNGQPVEVELGCGKGLFLVMAGAAHPEVNYLGIEVSLPWLCKAKQRIAKSGLDNIRLLHVEALYFMERYVAAASVAAYHLYFPDPWPKKRHAKRRLVQPPFAIAVRRTLIPGGMLYVATDAGFYFEQIQTVLGNQTGLVPTDQWPPLEEDPAQGGITSYERKYHREGRSIYRAAYRKET